MERTGYDDMRKGCKGIGCDWWDGVMGIAGWVGMGCVCTRPRTLFFLPDWFTHIVPSTPLHPPDTGYDSRYAIRRSQHRLTKQDTDSTLLEKKSVKIEISVNIC